MAYSVAEVADMLGVSEETVRKWIRQKKLEGEKSSRKEGYKVTKEQLLVFLESVPKYAVIASIIGGKAVRGSSIPLAIAAGLVAGGGLAIGGVVSTAAKSKQTHISFSELLDAANKDIEANRELIKENENVIWKLQQKNKEMRGEIKRLESAIERVKAEFIDSNGKDSKRSKKN